MSLTINAFAGLVRAGLRIVIQSTTPVVCCNMQMEFQPGGLIGQPFFTVFCETCFTVFIQASERGTLEKYLRDAGRLDSILGRAPLARLPGRKRAR